MNLTTSSTDQKESYLNKFAIIARGNCTFVTKVRNAEKAGASVVIVVDDRVENITNVIMGDDGTGTGIRIPSMLVGKDSGQKLKDQMVLGQGVTLSAEFILPNYEIAEVEFWYSSNNDVALNFIKEFDNYVHRLEDNISFTPRFVTWACPLCTDDFKEKECLSDGKYCAPNHGYSMFSMEKGVEIMKEDLRQSCLHKKLKAEGREAVWWDYAKYTHQECYGFISLQCSKDGHKKVGEDFDTTMQCYRDSFEGPNETGDNKILKANSEQWSEYGTYYWPAIVINSKTIREDITAENILEAVCAGLKKKPDICIEFYKEENIPYYEP